MVDKIKLWGKPVTDREELQHLKELRKKLYNRRLPDAERAAIFKELKHAFRIVKPLTFFQSEIAIDIHLQASGYFLRIKELGLREGKQVSWAGERIGIIDSIYYDGYLKVCFNDGQKPTFKRSSPWMVELV